MSQSVKVPLLVRNGLMNFQKDLLVRKLYRRTYLSSLLYFFALFRQYLFFSLVLVYITF